MAEQPRCPGTWKRPNCGRPTYLIQGHAAQCLPCCETEIGTTVVELRERVTAALQKGRSRKWSLSTGRGARRWDNAQRQ
jgi:hypothetical protein